MMNYLKLSFGFVMVGLIITGCKKEVNNPVNQVESNDLVVSGGGPSKPKSDKGNFIKKQGGNQGGKSTSSVPGTPAYMREKRAGRKILGNSRDHLIFDAKGDLVKARPNAKYDMKESGILFSYVYGIVKYERMRKLPDGWYEPRPDVSWGTGQADINESVKSDSTPETSIQTDNHKGIEGSSAGTTEKQDLDKV